MSDWLVLAAVGAAAATVLLSWLRARRLRAQLDGLANGLLSLKERDYTVRMADVDGRGLGELARNFNALGVQLRGEHSERYQRELLLEAVLEATPAAAMLVDAGETIVFANGAARALFWGGAIMTGHSLSEILARVSGSLREALASGDEGLFTTEQDGADTVHVSQRALVLNYQPHRLLIVSPLTRALARQEADAWKRAIRVMSHEINNSLAPVASLVNTARRIMERPEPAQKLGEVFDTIADRTQHLKTFLDGYAQFARLPRPVLQPIDWRTFLERARALYEFALPVEPPADAVEVDPAQMQQVLLNLLKNAVESGSAPGDIRVTVERIDEGTVLEVADGGGGMTDAVLKQVLVPFYSTKKSGSGIGLPLCREIVEAHGGTLSISSRPGAGTTVRCILPRSPRAPQA